MVFRRVETRLDRIRSSELRAVHLALHSLLHRRRTGQMDPTPAENLSLPLELDRSPSPSPSMDRLFSLSLHSPSPLDHLHLDVRGSSLSPADDSHSSEG